MFKKRLPIVILILAIIATFLVRFTYFSLGLGILTFILCLVFSKKNVRILLFTIIISVATIITNVLILYKDTYLDIGKFTNRNILIGIWQYDNDTGKYVFNDDYTYIKYYDLDNMENYCVGTYEYNYGGTDINGNVIRQDNNYYYFDLVFNTDTCITDGNEEYINNNETLIFGINKDNSNDLIFIESYNNYVYKAIKILE